MITGIEIIDNVLYVMLGFAFACCVYLYIKLKILDYLCEKVAKKLMEIDKALTKYTKPR